MARNKIRRYGTRAEVMSGTARMTQGRLTKKKSIKMKGNENPLKKQKYLQTKKGSFGPARRKTKSFRKKK